MKALVVGGNGFLGSHVADELADQGHETTVFDRFSRGDRKFTNKDIRVYKGDFLNNADIRSAVQGKDVVFHFLSATTPATAAVDPTVDVRINVAQSIELFAASARAGVSRIYFASTGGAMYGDPGTDSVSEDSMPMPKSPYAIGKLTLENYLEYFSVEFGMDHRILRISNPYGSRQNPTKPQGLIPIALRRVAEGLPITRVGDGSMVRDYVYVHDLVKQISSIFHGDSLHRTYNLGSGIGFSVSDILEKIAIITGRPLQIESVPTPSTFINRVVLDMTRFHTEFGVRSYTDIEEGIAQTWASIQNP